MSQNQPISRNDLQQLKAKTDEKKRLEQVNQHVNHIYSSVVSVAESKTITSYNYQIQQHYSTFFEKNKL